MRWYERLTEWRDGHDTDDPSIASQPIRACYAVLRGRYPPMNGPHAAHDPDDVRVSDYAFHPNALYVAFAWSVADEARADLLAAARTAGVGVFLLSEPDGPIVRPGRGSDD